MAAVRECVNILQVRIQMGWRTLRVRREVQGKDTEVADADVRRAVDDEVRVYDTVLLARQHRARRGGVVGRRHVLLDPVGELLVRRAVRTGVGLSRNHVAPGRDLGEGAHELDALAEGLEIYREA